MYVHVSVSVFDSLHSTHATEEWSADNNATAAAKEARDNDLKVVVGVIGKASSVYRWRMSLSKKS
jgi:hypothetical protein